MYWISAAIIVVLDRITKHWVESNLAVGEGFNLIPGLLDFLHVQNTGAAFSNFQGKGTMLMVVTGVLMLGICIYVSLPRFKVTRLEKLSLGFIFGGGLGNMICRAVHGCVTDFLDIHILPVFNVADIFICIGCGLLLIGAFAEDKNKEDK